MKTVVVNAVGDRCPIPVVKTLKAMSALTEPSVIEVLVDDVIPVQNLTRLAEGKPLCRADGSRRPRCPAGRWRSCRLLPRCR